MNKIPKCLIRLQTIKLWNAMSLFPYILVISQMWTYLLHSPLVLFLSAPRYRYRHRPHPPYSSFGGGKHTKSSCSCSKICNTNTRCINLLIKFEMPESVFSDVTQRKFTLPQGSNSLNRCYSSKGLSWPKLQAVQKFLANVSPSRGSSGK